MTSKKPPCPNGTQCLLQNDVNHCGQYSHSPLKDCPYGSTCRFIADPVHCQAFRHIRTLENCPYGSVCLLRSSPEHEARFDHSGPGLPPPVPPVSTLAVCSNGGLCYRRERQHAVTHSHPPGWTPESGFQKSALAASQANDTARNQSMTSGQDSRPRCSHYAECYRLNRAHAAQEAHPQGWKPGRQPPAGPSSSSVSAPSSAPRPDCQYGMGCYQTSTQHVQGFKHPTGWYVGLVPKPDAQTSSAPGPLTRCQWWDKCYQRNPIHAKNFSHPPGWVPVARTLTPCRYGSGCYITNPLHPTKYSHPPGWNPAAVKRGYGGRTSWNTSARWSHLRSNVRTLYHQTDGASAAAIVASQEFRRGKDGWAGGGIYFAESAAETNAKAHHKGVILKATVYLGRVKNVDTSSNFKSTHFHGLLSEGFDSIMIPASSGKEFVVYNRDQVKNIQKN